MRKRGLIWATRLRLWRGFLALVVVALTFSVNITASALAADASSDLATLPDSVSVNLSTLRTTRAPADVATEQIAISLRPRNTARFNQIARDVDDPTSPQYGHYLTLADIQRDFSPTQADFDSVAGYFRTKGLTVAFSAPHRLLLTVEGTRPQIDAAFNTTSVYGRNRIGDAGYINTTAARLPKDVAAPIQAVSGLDGTVQAHTHNRSQPATPQPNAKPFTSYGVHDPTSVRTAYNVPAIAANDGTGVTVAILIWSPPTASYITAWNTNYASFPPITYTVVGNTTVNSAYGETDLDLVNVHSAAPGATLKVYSATSATNASLLTSLTQAVTDGVNVTNHSYGSCGATTDAGTINSWHSQLTTAKALGITTFVSSGDEGIFGCTPSSGAKTNTPGYAEFPSSDDYVTAVGATYVGINASTYAWTSESAWSCPTADGSNDLTCLRASAGGTANGGSSGGGLESNTGQPGYQVGIVTDPGTKFDSGTVPVGRSNYSLKRATPDISSNGDPASGIIFYDATSSSDPTPAAYQGGGTSASSPWLAGVAALVRKAKGANVGQFNPFLYQNCTGSTWCYDVTSGYNGASAAAGWDFVTGLGAVKDVTKLIASYTGATTTLNVAAPAVTYRSVVTNVQIIARNTNNDTAAAYTGTVKVTTDDPKAVLPANYTFTAADIGRHSLPVIFTTPGTRTITVTDTVTGTITGSTTIAVQNVAATLKSDQTGTVKSGDVVTFSLAFSNPGAITYSGLSYAVALPTGLTLASGSLSGSGITLTPDASAAPSYTAPTITATVGSVSDNQQLTTTASYSYTGATCGGSCASNPLTLTARIHTSGPTAVGLYTQGWSGSGSGTTTLSAPQGVAADTSAVYIDTSTGLINKYNGFSTSWATAKNYGVATGQMNAEGNGGFYLTFPNNNLVYHFANFASAQDRSYSTGTATTPYAVAVEGTSGVYIALTGSGTVKYYSGTSTTADRTYTGLTVPRGIVADGTNGVYISDSGNNRILYYPASCNTATVLTTCATRTYTGLTPRGLALDPNGGLWAVDFAGHRVLHYSGTSTTADMVLGQPDLTTVTSGATNDKLNQPNGIATDAYGTVWVADTTNNRVVRYSLINTALSATPNTNLTQGTPVTYTLTLTHTSATPYTNVALNVPLPTGMTFAQGSVQVVTNGVRQTNTAFADPTAGMTVTLPQVDGNGNVSTTVITFGAVVNGQGTPSVPPVSPLTATANYYYAGSPCPTVCTSNSTAVTVNNATSPLAARIAYAKVSLASNSETKIEWATARETNLLGYNVYALTATSKTRLNAHIIPAHSLSNKADSLYNATVTLPVGTTGIVIADVEPGGRLREHGPYALNTTIGTIPVSAPAATSDRSPTSGGTPTPIPLASRDVALSITQDGIYHLSYAQLVAQGLNLRGAKPAKLALSANGQNVPLYVKAASAGRFSAGDYIEFVAAPTPDFYNSGSTYVLTARPSGKVTHLKEAPSVSLAPKPGDPAATTVSRDLAGQHFYWNSAPSQADAWNWALLENDIPELADQSVMFDLPRLYNADNFGSQSVGVTLRLRGWGGYDSANPDHHAIAELGGVSGDATFDGDGSATISLSVPAAALKETGNVLRLRTPGDMGVEYDTMVLQSIGVNYPRATTLPAPATQVADVRAFTRTSQLAQSIRAQAKGNKLDYVVVAPSAYIAGVAALVQQHRAEGMRVAVVDANAVYDAYGTAKIDAAAIQKFVAAQTKARGLKYVLLIGADNWDALNRLGYGSYPVMPAFRLPDSYGTLAPSDAAYADSTADGLPDVAVGRLPVRNTAELTAMIAKSVGFSATSTIAPAATFVTDPTEATFAAMAQADAARLPASAHITNITWTTQADKAAATAALVARWRAGSRIVTYTGHSNADVWADDVVLDGQALDNLHGTTSALVAVWGCAAALYDKPGVTVLSQALLSLPDGGAAVVVASTTEVTATQYSSVSQTFYGALYANGTGRIGDAFVVATRSAERGATDLATGFTLLGDPAARM